MIVESTFILQLSPGWQWKNEVALQLPCTTLCRCSMASSWTLVPQTLGFLERSVFVRWDESYYAGPMEERFRSSCAGDPSRRVQDMQGLRSGPMEVGVASNGNYSRSSGCNDQFSRPHQRNCDRWSGTYQWKIAISVSMMIICFAFFEWWTSTQFCVTCCYCN